MSKPCTRREEVYLSFKRLDGGVQTLWARRYGGNPVSSGPMTVWKSSVKEKSKISGCLCNISVCKPCVRVKGLRFGNAKRKAKSEECFYCAES